MWDPLRSRPRPTPSADRAFTVLPSPTRRGARLARLLAVAHLGAWGLPSETAAHIVAELAANASVHGRVQGRDFQLTLAVSGRTLRIEVTDTRGDSTPPGPGAVKAPEDDSEHGRGLLIVEALADHWGITPGPVPRKTVWAEIDLVR
ncbi:ATP-binding protein [Streptomyces microflavus]|uniref:ATP-binding protein n=1 Tax=Streptomyces microflavus TaxID=1919 RepID=UPI0033B03E4C